MNHKLFTLVATLLLITSCQKPEKKAPVAKEENKLPLILRTEENTKVEVEATIAKKATAPVVEEVVVAERVKPPQIRTISAPKRYEKLGDDDIALVDGIAVKDTEFKRVFAGEALDNMPNYLLREYNKSRGEFIDRLINNKIFEQAASLEDFTKDEKYIAAVDDALKKVNMQFFYERYVGNQVKSSEADYEKYYNDHPAEFTEPAKVRASHILVAVKPNAYMAELTNAKRKTKELREKVCEGEDFAEIAGAESDCPSKLRGGDLGFFQRGQMEPKFENAAFSLEKDEISDIVETEFGYHIIKLTDRIPKRQKPYKEVKNTIKTKVDEEQESKVYQALVTALTNKFKVIRNEKVIRDLVQPY